MEVLLSTYKGKQGKSEFSHTHIKNIYKMGIL